MEKAENRAQAQEGQHRNVSYTVGTFEGPLDLLLYLIQKSQLNIYDIPISEITDQFLGYLNDVKDLDLEDLTDFYRMAAQLIYMKSRLLLPQDMDDEDEEFEDPRAELVEQLLEYQKYKRYASLLAGEYERGETVFQRHERTFLLPFTDEQLLQDASLWDLLKTFTALMRSISFEQVFNVYEEVTVKQKLALLLELCENREEIAFHEIVERPDSDMHIICAFFAVLEAAKYGMITLCQSTLSDQILIRKKYLAEGDQILDESGQEVW